jgi:hypothetical protein
MVWSLSNELDSHGTDPGLGFREVVAAFSSLTLQSVVEDFGVGDSGRIDRH